MVAAIGDNVTFNRNVLLNREDFQNKGKIDALKVATAVLLSNSNWNVHRDTINLAFWPTPS